jgi:hypothetical protein
MESEKQPHSLIRKEGHTGEAITVIRILYIENIWGKKELLSLATLTCF